MEKANHKEQSKLYMSAQQATCIMRYSPSVFGMESCIDFDWLASKNSFIASILELACNFGYEGSLFKCKFSIHSSVLSLHYKLIPVQ